MNSTQTIYNQARYDQETKYIKGRNYALQLHKLYNIDDLALINMIQQDNKFKKFVRKLNKKYYNSIDKHDLKAIIEDILFEIARNRESIVVNYDQMISYTIKSIENRCKDYLKLKYSPKRGYKDGECLVSSLHKYINDLGELPFEDKTSMYEYEEVEFKMAITQELNRVKTTKSRKRVALEYMLLVSQGGTVTDKVACEQIGCDVKTLKQAKTLLQKVTTNILSEL